MLVDSFVGLIREGPVLHPVFFDIRLFRLRKKAKEFGERDTERSEEDREALVVSEDSSAVKPESSSMASAGGGVGSAVGKSFFPLAGGFPERLEVCFLAFRTDDLAVALELPEVALAAPLRREVEEDFVKVGDEKGRR
jgi:hypothetical protein